MRSPGGLLIQADRCPYERGGNGNGTEKRGLGRRRQRHQGSRGCWQLRKPGARLGRILLRSSSGTSPADAFTLDIQPPGRCGVSVAISCPVCGVLYGSSSRLRQTRYHSIEVSPCTMNCWFGLSHRGWWVYRSNVPSTDTKQLLDARCALCRAHGVAHIQRPQPRGSVCPSEKGQCPAQCQAHQRHVKVSQLGSQMGPLKGHLVSPRGPSLALGPRGPHPPPTSVSLQASPLLPSPVPGSGPHADT